MQQFVCGTSLVNQVGDVLALADEDLDTPWEPDCNQGQAQHEGLSICDGNDSPWGWTIQRQQRQDVWR